MLRAFVIYILLTATAVALHENTFAVFELREELQMLYMNMWELLYQLQYVTADQRPVVYSDIQHIQSEIQRVIQELIQHDQQQHP